MENHEGSKKEQQTPKEIQNPTSPKVPIRALGVCGIRVSNPAPDED
jgi:hypothetical protein